MQMFSEIQGCFLRGLDADRQNVNRYQADGDQYVLPCPQKKSADYQRLFSISNYIIQLSLEFQANFLLGKLHTAKCQQ